MQCVNQQTFEFLQKIATKTFPVKLIFCKGISAVKIAGAGPVFLERGLINVWGFALLTLSHFS